MRSDLVSVVITTYRRPIAVLKRAIDSAVNQTYKNIEIIVVNDYPEDSNATREMSEMITSCYSTVQFLSTKDNSGACAARNLGMLNSHGQFIAFLDDDDEWYENKIEVQLSGVCNDKVGVVYTPFFKDYGTKKILACKDGCSGSLLKSLLYGYDMGLFPLIKTIYVKEIGGFDERLPSSQDHDLFLRLSQMCDFSYVSIPTANYTMSVESISTDVKKKIEGFDLFMEKHTALYNDCPDAYHYQMIRMCNNMITAGQYAMAYRYWKKAVSVGIFRWSNLIEPTKGFIKRFQKRTPFR